VLARSFTVYLRAFAAELEDGAYVYSEDHGGLVEPADLD
jgi:hypothetical protein